MQLDEKDIEAVAKSRVSREENNKTNTWMVGSAIAVVGGVLLVSVSKYLGWGVSVAGFAALFWSINKLQTKQKNYAQQLLTEWDKEQADAAAKQDGTGK